MSEQGMLADHFFYSGRTQFDEGRYQPALRCFERLLERAENLERVLLEALAALAAGFELYQRQRMITPALVQLEEAQARLEQIPLTELQGVDVRGLKDQLIPWLGFLQHLGQTGASTVPPPRLRIG